jgi:hypothetical protein
VRIGSAADAAPVIRNLNSKFEFEIAVEVNLNSKLNLNVAPPCPGSPHSIRSSGSKYRHTVFAMMR